MRTTAVLGAVFLAAAAIVATAVVYRLEVTATLLRYGLSRAGFPAARLRVEEVGLHRMSVVDVEAGEALRLPRVEVSFDLRRLPKSPVERVRVVGARLNLPTPSAAAPEKAPAGFPLGLLPALELEDTVVTIPSDLGAVSLRLSSSVTPANGSLAMELEGAVESAVGGAGVHGEARRNEAGAVALSVKVSSLRVRHPRLRVADGSATLRFEGESSGLDLKTATGELDLSLTSVFAGDSELGDVTAAIPLALERRDGQWLARLSKADLRLSGRGLKASGISGEASAKSTDLQVERLIDTKAERRFEPLSLHLRLGETAPDFRFAVDVSAAGGRAALRAEGRYETARRSAEVDLTLRRLEFQPDHLRPADLSPLLAQAGPASGSVEGKAHVRWEPATGASATATISLEGLSLDSSSARIDGLSGTIDLSRLSPLETAGLQTLRIHEINPGLALSDAVLRWALEPAKNAAGSRLRIDRFETGFVGGRMVVENALLDPLAKTNQLEFRFEELDVQRLFEIVGLEGVTGSGRLSGAIPVTMQSGAVAIHEGKLTGQAGLLRLRSAAAAKLLAGGGESAQLLLDALQDFHYDQITLTAEKSFDGDSVIQLHLDGLNPDVLAGRRFRINLNLTGNLDRLTRSLLEVARLSDRAVRATVGAVR